MEDSKGSTRVKKRRLIENDSSNEEETQNKLGEEELHQIENNNSNQTPSIDPTTTTTFLSTEESRKEENEDAIKERRIQAAKRAAEYNSRLLESRKERGPFYYDPHTNTTQVIGSWTLNLVITEEWLEKQRVQQEEQIKRDLERRTQTMSDKELHINIAPPKNALSAFMIFSTKIRPRVKRENPDANLPDLSRIIGGMWKTFSDEQKKEYELLAEQEKERYRRELAEYKDQVKRARENLLSKLPSVISSTGGDVNTIDISALAKLPSLNFESEKPTKQQNLSPEQEKERRLKNKKCQRCGEKIKGSENTLRCSVCYRAYHPACLELSDQTMEKIKQYNIKTWKCQDCKNCTICTDPGGDKQILLCDVCDRGFHTFCLDPPLTRPPKGRWVCNDCVECRSCGKKNPGNAPAARWHKGYTLCSSCDKLIGEKKYCPVCEKAYKHQDKNPMIQCDSCAFWVHTACDNISEEQYAQFSLHPEESYYCPKCKQLLGPTVNQNQTSTPTSTNAKKSKKKNANQTIEHNINTTINHDEEEESTPITKKKNKSASKNKSDSKNSSQKNKSKNKQSLDLQIDEDTDDGYSTPTSRTRNAKPKQQYTEFSDSDETTPTPIPVPSTKNSKTKSSKKPTPTSSKITPSIEKAITPTTAPPTQRARYSSTPKTIYTEYDEGEEDFDEDEYDFTPTKAKKNSTKEQTKSSNSNSNSNSNRNSNKKTKQRQREWISSEEEGDEEPVIVKRKKRK